jgi:Holliday junction resolvasome RuvABC endonuclease subunit
MKTVLGFDVSSKTIGWCVLEINDQGKIKFVKAHYVKPPKKGHIIERLADTRDQIQKIIGDVKPDYIGIEDIIQFMAGKSTAKTIITLTAFNRMVGLLAHDYLERAPELFNVMSIRHGLKTGKVLPKKEDMPKLVSKHLKIKFPYEYIAKGKYKGNIKEESVDVADGIAVALYYAYVLTGKINRK